MLARSIARGLRRPAASLSQQTGRRSFAALGQSTSTQTPILYYTSTQQATSSINHRMFYVNVVAMLAVADAFNTLVDF